jgi:hypothetical protein
MFRPPRLASRRVAVPTPTSVVRVPPCGRCSLAVVVVVFVKCPLEDGRVSTYEPFQKKMTTNTQYNNNNNK